MNRLYGAAIEQAAARIGEHAGRVLRETEEAPVLLAELLGQPRDRRRALAGSEPRFRLLKLCDQLETASRQAWADDPAAALELAGLAVEIAERLDADRYGEALVEDARALAWAYLGNARRIAGDLDRSEEALARAEAHYRKFETDLLTEAEILGFEASLRNTQGRFAEAATLLDRVLRLYRETGDRHQEGRALILKGMILGDGGDFREAVRHLGAGLHLVDGAAEPRLLLVARHNLAWYLSDDGRHREALAALEPHRQLYLELGNRMDLLRLRWLEGRIALGLGRLDEGEEALGLAREAFLEQGICFDAALVSLDLAMVHARRGDTAGVQRIASEIVPVFQACGVHPEAIAALLLVCQTERITAEFLDRVADYLRRSRRDPELRFEG
ncbi:MAG TPA: tetratricopeptide repeat protein [Thermoanaerobaculia bacterium]|nr:tetratricopeptide repeat protein [Thermoanaerobaculia bacterium]